ALYRDFLSGLSIFRNMRLPLPGCAEQILLGWLGGKRVDDIADLLEVKEAALGRSDVSTFIDEFCSTRLPWALTAMRGYAASIAPNPIAESWLTAWSAMVHFGLSSPKAAMFYALGLRSREAAIACSLNCGELTQSPNLIGWLVGLSNDEVARWELTDYAQREIMAHRDNLKSIGEEF
ncbi:MAG TPA: hypothetical protein VL334_05665, partial [Anaerolineae bacterium]|nr:hypothetical protein [Anaerolineae bacterium]